MGYIFYIKIHTLKFVEFYEYLNYLNNEIILYLYIFVLFILVYNLLFLHILNLELSHDNNRCKYKHLFFLYFNYLEIHELIYASSLHEMDLYDRLLKIMINLNRYIQINTDNF